MNDDFDFAGAADVDNPILKVGEEKEIGKQGLKKKLLKEGEGWDTPEVGDEVQGTTTPLTLSLCVCVCVPFPLIGLDFIELVLIFWIFWICSSLYWDVA